jgi:hypothetical protein
MKLTEVLERLYKIYEEQGNFDVKLYHHYGDEGRDPSPVTKIEVMTDHLKQPFVIMEPDV